MLAPPLDARITFPHVPGVEYGRDRFEVSQLYGPFEQLGERALSAMAVPETRETGKDIISFLAGAGKFVAGEYGAQDDRRGYEYGDHEYALDLNAQDGKALARRIYTTEDRGFSRVVVGFFMRTDLASRVSAVDLSMFYATQGHRQSVYVRLGCTDKSYMGGQDYDITFSAAIGEITRSGRIIPDISPSFSILASIGQVIGRYRGAHT